MPLYMLLCFWTCVRMDCMSIVYWINHYKNASAVVILRVLVVVSVFVVVVSFVVADNHDALDKTMTVLQHWCARRVRYVRVARAIALRRPPVCLRVSVGHRPTWALIHQTIRILMSKKKEYSLNLNLEELHLFWVKLGMNLLYLHHSSSKTFS